MTESSFPFAAEEPEAVAAAPAADRKKLLLASGAGALAVAMLGYFVVLPAFSGDSADAAPATAIRKTQPKGSAADKKAPAAKPAAKKPVTQPASYNDVASRDNPFHPLYIPPQKRAVPVSTAGPGTGPAPAAPGTGTGTTTTPPTGAGSGSGSNASVGGQRVALMTVYGKDGVQYAQTKVGDVVYTPKVGQVFAVSYKLLATSGKSATFLYGDEQFTLSVGQEVLK